MTGFLTFFAKNIIAGQEGLLVSSTLTAGNAGYRLEDGRVRSASWPHVQTQAALDAIAPAVAAALRATVASEQADVDHVGWLIAVDAETFVVAQNLRRALAAVSPAVDVVYLGAPHSTDAAATTTPIGAICGAGFAFRRPVRKAWLDRVAVMDPAAEFVAALAAAVGVAREATTAVCTQPFLCTIRGCAVQVRCIHFHTLCLSLSS